MSEAGRLFDEMLDTLRPKGDRWRGCIIGDFSGNIDAPLQGWKYVRVPIAGSGDYSLAMFPGQNVSGTAYNTPVIIEYDALNNQRIIVGPDVQGLGAVVAPSPTIPDPGGYTVPAHAWTHQKGGPDQMVVYEEQLSNLQVFPSTINTQHIIVSGGLYVVGGTLIKLQTTVDVDLSSYFPASGVKYVWVTMTAAGAAVVVDPSVTSVLSLTLPATANYVVSLVMLQASQPIGWPNIKSAQSYAGAGQDWRLLGNDNVNASTHFLGSINDADVVFKRHNAEIARLTSTGVLSPLLITTKPTGTAGIQFDPNAATGNFVVSLSPANLTDNHRVTFGDVTGIIALGAGTLTSMTTNDVTVSAHTHAITPEPALVGPGGAQYQVITAGVGPAYLPDWSGFLVSGTTGGRTNLAITNNEVLTITSTETCGLTLIVGANKTLTLTSADNFNLTIPKTGTAAMGTGTVGRIAEWITDTNTLQASTLIKTGTNTLTLATGTIAATVWTIPANVTGVLTNNGAGVLSWEVGGATPPGGVNTQVQFNDGGAFGGDADFTWNKTTNVLTLVNAGYGDIVISGAQLAGKAGTVETPTGTTITVVGGAGYGANQGGNFYANGGVGGATGAGGSLLFQGGNGGATSGAGGPISFVGGNAAAGNSSGGNITFRPGAKTGAGTAGKFLFQDATSLVTAVLDTSALATSDKTYTLPNVTGTVALGTGVAGQVAEWVTTANTLQAAKLIGPVTNILTLTATAASTLGMAVSAGKTVTLTATDNSGITFTSACVLTIPTAGAVTAALLGTANIFKAVQTVNLNAVALPAPPTGTLLHLGNVDATATRFTMDSFATNCIWVFRRANNTNASPTALAANDNITAMTAFGYYTGNSSGYTTSGRASMNFLAAEAWSDVAQGAYITFGVTAIGAVAQSEAARITSAKGLKIVGAFGCNGTTEQTAYASGSALAAYATGVFGLDSGANMSALHAMVVKIRAALIANGIMS